MQEIIFDIMNQYGYLGILLLILVASIFIPIPSEIILTFGGFMTTYTRINVWGVVIAATMGSLIGAVIIYAIGRAFNADRLESLTGSKWGRLLHLREGDFKRAEKLFLKHGKKAIFICRFVPVLRSLISVPAGAARIGLPTFVALTVSGAFIWNTALVFVGRIMGGAWEKAMRYFDMYFVIAAAVFALIAIAAAAVYVKKRFLS